MNNVILIGRLTRDPWTNGDGDNPVAKFTMAVDRQKEGADYPNCVAWGKTAEVVGKYLKKGALIAVSGMIRTGSYKKDGEDVYTTDVAVNRVKFLESKKDSEKKDDTKDDFEAIDEDVPF